MPLASTFPDEVSNPVSVNTKRVFYVKYLADPVFAETLAQRPDVRLDRLENDAPEEVAAPVLAAAHVYQVGSARDEIARAVSRGCVADRAGARPPDRVDQRGRLRHRRREVLHRCRGAGAQPGRRQSRGGRRACGRHAADAVEADRRDQPGHAENLPDRPHRLYGQRRVRQDHRHHRARPCRQPHRRAVPRPVLDARARL